MAITVVCPGCMKRFSVGDQHAGKQGPCPQCKTVIDIPKLEDAVVIHAPDDGGPKDAKGRSVLKTTKTKDAKFNPMVAGGIAGVVLLVLLAAFLMRGTEAAGSTVLLAGGAVLLGPILAFAGYGFLRDQELEPYRGTELAIRAVACGLVFAAGWGIYSLLGYQMLGEWPIEKLEIFHMLIAAGAAVGIATFGSYVAMDLEPTSGIVHCALFFLVTVLLRVVMGLPAVPGLVTE